MKEASKASLFFIPSFLFTKGREGNKGIRVENQGSKFSKLGKRERKAKEASVVIIAFSMCFGSKLRVSKKQAKEGFCCNHRLFPIHFETESQSSWGLFDSISTSRKKKFTYTISWFHPRFFFPPRILDPSRAASSPVGSG